MERCISSGAVAGLADKPIKNVIASQETIDRNQSKSTATGIVTGMGQGIIGAFTKPIGGAAEFVSRTGQGYLFTHFFLWIIYIS